MALPGFAKEWLEQWRSAGPELEQQRARDLQLMTEDQARAATRDLLDLAERTPIPPNRWRWSGLVTQQALFHRRRPPEPE
jgi:hypothetical protein